MKQYIVVRLYGNDNYLPDVKGHFSTEKEACDFAKLYHTTEPNWSFGVYKAVCATGEEEQA